MSNDKTPFEKPRRKLGELLKQDGEETPVVPPPLPPAVDDLPGVDMHAGDPIADALAGIDPDAPKGDEPKGDEPKVAVEKLPTVEELALMRGLLPMWIPGTLIRVNQMGVVREIQPPPTVNPEHWKFAAAKTLKQWPEGAELSLENFDKAIHEAINQRIG